MAFDLFEDDEPGREPRTCPATVYNILSFCLGTIFYLLFLWKCKDTKFPRNFSKTARISHFIQFLCFNWQHIFVRNLRLLTACFHPFIFTFNDVNDQQDATTFSFINLFNSALHVSGDKFAHPQKHVLNVYTAFGTIHRHCCQSAAVSVHCTKSYI